jgi:hypothetical protein
MGGTTTVMTGQTDLFALLEETKLVTPAPSLYGSPARGLAARSREYQAWRAEHGGFGALGRSHAWTVWINLPRHPDRTLPAHRPVRRPSLWLRQPARPAALQMRRRPDVPGRVPRLRLGR